MTLEEKKILLFEPDDLQRMLIEIWLSRTPFSNITYVQDLTNILQCLMSRLYSVIICNVEIPQTQLQHILSAASKNSVNTLLLYDKFNKELEDVTKKFKSISTLQCPFQQKDLVESLVKLNYTDTP
jgi:DNA-binding NtrC family response regulator